MHFKAVFSLIILVTLCAMIGVIWALTATSPTQIGPLGVTIWFVGLLAGLSGAISLFLFAVRSRLWPMDAPPKRLSASWREGFLLSVALTTILGLQSLRQLSWRDVVLVVILVGLVEFYFRTRK